MDRYEFSRFISSVVGNRADTIHINRINVFNHIRFFRVRCVGCGHKALSFRVVSYARACASPSQPSYANLVMPIPSNVSDPFCSLVCSFFKNLEETNDHTRCRETWA